MAAPKAPVLQREQLVALVTGMLSKKGPVMAAELQRRVDAGEGLTVRGVTVDVSMLVQALQRYDNSGMTAAAAAPPPAAESGKVGESDATAVAAADAAKPAAASSQRWAAAAPSAVGGRWSPGAPSASLLAARAMEECDSAEVFNRQIRVMEGFSVAVMGRPDMLADPTGEFLASGEVASVVARSASPKDGRVWLRLQRQYGWISTRARQEFDKVVLEPVGSATPLEPKRFLDPVESTALRLLPTVDTISAAPAPAPPQSPSLQAAAGSTSAPEAAEGLPPAATPTASQELESESEFEGSEEEDLEEDAEVDELDGEGVDGEGASGAQGSAAPKKAVKKRPRTFKVLLPRLPILNAPCAEQLMSTSRNMDFYEHHQEFIADGAIFQPSEGRTYLRLSRGRGWVCERAPREFRKITVAPVTKRKHKLSKKAARVVAFHGGDTDGVIGLKKADLTKNAAGKIVSKKASEASKKRFANSSISKWTMAVKKARQDLGVGGFVAVKKGTPIYDKAREYFEALKAEQDQIAPEAATPT